MFFYRKGSDTRKWQLKDVASGVDIEYRCPKVSKNSEQVSNTNNHVCSTTAGGSSKQLKSLKQTKLANQSISAPPAKTVDRLRTELRIKTLNNVRILEKNL